MCSGFCASFILSYLYSPQLRLITFIGADYKLLPVYFQEMAQIKYISLLIAKGKFPFCIVVGRADIPCGIPNRIKNRLHGLGEIGSKVLKHDFRNDEVISVDFTCVVGNMMDCFLKRNFVALYPKKTQHNKKRRLDVQKL